jgi:hypothetical protein
LLLAALGATTGATLAAAAPAHAASWACRGSAVSASLAANPPVEPFVANSGFTPCVTAQVGPQNVTAAAGLPAGVVSAVTASASTTITPEAGPSAAQSIGAVGRVEELSVHLPAGTGALTLGVRAATARVTGACIGATPVLSGAGEVLGLTVNGTELPADQALARISAVLAPLGQVAELKLDEQVSSASALVHRALHLRVLDASGTPLLDVVAGDARGGFDGAACQAAATTGTGPGAGPGGTGPGTVPGTGPGTGNGTGPAAGTTNGTATGTAPNLRACPNGSELLATSGLCVIRVAATTVQGERLISVGRPFEGPSAGTVVSLEEARRRWKSPCLSGAGPRFVIVGTARADRITGTNRADRLLLLGGNDRGDGGRGNDCVDGGTGRDVVSGSQDRDRVFGMAGNDSLNGGPSSDHLSGGTGNDTINAAYGADRVLGGPGRDAINVATAGPRARVSCGTGRDVVRMNASERRSARGCERRLILPDKRVARR